MPPRPSRVLDRRQKLEKEISDMHEGDFVVAGSRGLKFLDAILDGEALAFDRKSLIALAMLFSAISNVRFPRDFTRRRTLIIKWFDQNLEALQPIRTVLSFSYGSLDLKPHHLESETAVGVPHVDATDLEFPRLAVGE
jgi:hypothetical protein